MTTPAVSINQTVKDTGTRLFTYSNGSVTESVINSPVVKRVYDQRPASVSNPLIKGWRRPWSYTRSVAKQYSILGDVYQEYVGPNNPGVHLVREDWFRGSFWSANSFPISFLPADDTISKLEDRALITALNKLKSGHVNIGVALAEAKQTARLLTSTVKDISEGVNSYRKRFPRQWEEVRKWQRGGSLNWRKIPDRWLEIQYGWNPLMSDVSGACYSLEKTWNENYPLIGVQGTSVLTDVTTRFGDGQYGSSLEERTDWVRLYKVSLYLELTSSWLAQFNALGLINPASIVWEKVPYSFVVDWFLPIGGWLSALDADFGYSFKGGSGTYLLRGKGRIVDHTIENKPNFIGSGQAPQINTEYMYMVRKRYTSTPVPGLHFKNPISASHIASAMSLLVSAFQPSSEKPRFRR